MIDLLKEYIEKLLRAKSLASKLKSYIAEEIIKQVPALVYERHNLNTDTIISNEYKLYLDCDVEKDKIDINTLANFLDFKEGIIIDEYNNRYKYSIDDIIYVNKTDIGHIIDTYNVDYYTDYVSNGKTKKYNYCSVRYIVQTLKITINVEICNDQFT